MNNCLDCLNCVPLEGIYILCNHPLWEEDKDLDMRTFHPSFGEICSDFEAGEENQ